MGAGAGAGVRACAVARAGAAAMFTELLDLDEAGKGEIVCLCGWIFLCPQDDSRKQGRKCTYKIISTCSYCYLDCLSFGLLYGHNCGFLDRLRHCLLDSHFTHLPSLRTHLLVLRVVVCPCGAVSDTDYMSILRLLVQRPFLHYVQGPIQRGVPRVLRRRMRR